MCIKSNHELDLRLIKEYGFLEEYGGVDLSEIEFLTDEKVAIISDITFALFEKIDKDFIEVSTAIPVVQ